VGSRRDSGNLISLMSIRERKSLEKTALCLDVQQNQKRNILGADAAAVLRHTKLRVDVEAGHKQLCAMKVGDFQRVQFPPGDEPF
jgi:hypothetical protein